MGILDDTELFTAIIQQGGFSRAARHLQLSNGLISRRIAALEAKLGVTLIKRTTRDLSLTAEGEIFLRHAVKIQEEMHSALTFIHTLADRPKGHIRISAPVYFGRRYLAPIILNFLAEFDGIKIELNLDNETADPIKERIDILVRGAGYLEGTTLKDSNLRMKQLISERIQLYASPSYLQRQGEPRSLEDLKAHQVIGYADSNPLSGDEVQWTYREKGIEKMLHLHPKFSANDIESGLMACEQGHGIARFTTLNAKHSVERKLIQPVLTQYDWGLYKLYTVYPQQKALPKRTRLLLDFIHSQMALLVLP